MPYLVFELRAMPVDTMQAFMEYASHFDSANNGKMNLKIVHTQAVTEMMNQLTEKLDLPQRMQELAYVTAVYHDIGRFEQLKRYNTFWDHQSIDHAELSCEILKEEHLLEGFTEREQQMILTAISNHNKLDIEPGLDEETLLLCRLIRDADKCDIYRVFAFEDMVDTMNETLEQVARETVTDIVYETVLAHRCVKREDRETGLDVWVGFLSFVFDINFKESMEYVQEKGYYKIPFEQVTFTNPQTVERIRKIFEVVEGYMRGMK